MDKGRENDKDKYKILCSKNDVVLKRANHSSSDANANTFLIDFEIVNSEITLDRFCSFNIFKLLFELNREDAIQDLQIVDLNDAVNTKDILIIFKKMRRCGNKTEIYEDATNVGGTAQRTNRSCELRI